MTEYLDESEICAYLKISPDQLKRIKQRREIAWYKFGGRARYTREDADDYAERQRVKALIQRPALVAGEKKRSPGRPVSTSLEAQLWQPGQKVV